MLAPDHDTVTCASDVLERARQHHAWRRQAFAQPRRRAVLKVVEPEPKPEPVPAPVHEPEEWPEPGESFALWWVQVKDRPGVDLDQLFPVWMRLKDEHHRKEVIATARSYVRIPVVIRATALNYSVDIQGILGKSLSRLKIIEPRQVAMFLACELTRNSMSEVARRFERDNTTVLHAVRKIKARLSTDAAFNLRVDMIRQQIIRQSMYGDNYPEFVSEAERSGLASESDTVRKGMADAVLATPAGLGRPLCKQGA
jgi:hypothetical protein